MKTYYVPLILLLSIAMSCKKDKNPASNDKEQLTPSNNLHGHYLFNGNGRDTSGNGQHATADNAITYAADRFSRAGKSLSLNGSSSFMNISGMTTGFPFTLSFWIKPADAAGIRNIISFSHGGQEKFCGYWVYTYQDQPAGTKTLEFGFGDGTGSTSSHYKAVEGSLEMVTGNWYHVVVVAKSASDVDLYVNNQKDLSLSYSGGATSMMYLTQNARIGADWFGARYFNGQLDDFRFYSRELSSSEITSIYTFNPF